MHQLPHRPILEMGDSPGAGKDRRIGDRLRRKQSLAAEIHGKRRAQTLAKRTLDKTNLRPTGGAERAYRPGGVAAINASRRKSNIGRGARQAAERRETHWRACTPQIAEKSPRDRRQCNHSTIPQGGPNAKT